MKMFIYLEKRTLIMELKTAIEKLEQSELFSEFKKENPDYYLAHAFTIVDKVQMDWQIGYYGKKKDNVFVFEVGAEVSKHPQSEVFKKPGTIVKELKLDDVRISLEQAVNITDELVKEKYSFETITKTIVIIQNLEKEIYNLTLVTATFHIINVKIDTITGEIISEVRESILGGIGNQLK